MGADRPAKADLVCVGAIAGAHGIRGVVRLKAFTERPEDVAAYGPVTDESGERSFEVTILSHAKGALLARLEGVGDRNAAEALTGLRLYVPRARLPEPAEEEFYHADLLGLAVELEDGTPLGTVVAVQDFGAGDLLEVRVRNGQPVMLPFTREAVPVVDLGAGRLVARPPAGLIGDEAAGAEDAAPDADAREE